MEDIKTTTICTTLRCFNVEEDYETISRVLITIGNDMLELTEVMKNYGELPKFEITITKRKVIVHKTHIVEVVDETYI